MKITERVEKVPGVTSAYWNSRLNQLTIYYSPATLRETVKTQVVATVADFDINAIDRFLFVSQ